MKLPVSDLTHAATDGRSTRPRQGLSALEYTVLVAIILVGAFTMWTKLGAALSTSGMQDDTLLEPPSAANPPQVSANDALRAPGAP
jgi:hypothetical protein